MFISAIETAEQAGREFAKRSQFAEHFANDSAAADARNAAYNAAVFHTPYMNYGPPWPPRMGPEPPPAVRRHLRELAREQHEHWFGPD